MCPSEIATLAGGFFVSSGRFNYRPAVFDRKTLLSVNINRAQKKRFLGRAVIHVIPDKAET
jgi:hypothetical protein